MKEDWQIPLAFRNAETTLSCIGYIKFQISDIGFLDTTNEKIFASIEIEAEVCNTTFHKKCIFYSLTL